MRAQFVSVTPVVSASVAYTAADSVGGLMTFDFLNLANRIGGHGGLILDQVRITDLDKQGADLDLLIFNANPAATTFTDNGAFTLADADIGKLVGFFSITADSLLADNSVTFIRNIGLLVPIMDTSTGAKVYGHLVGRTTTPTYTTTSAIVVTLGARVVPG